MNVPERGFRIAAIAGTFTFTSTFTCTGLLPGFFRGEGVTLSGDSQEVTT